MGKVDGSPGISLGGQAELRCLLEPHPRPGEALSFVAEGVPIESEWWAPGEQALGRQLALPPTAVLAGRRRMLGHLGEEGSAHTKG